MTKRKIKPDVSCACSSSSCSSTESHGHDHDHSDGSITLNNTWHLILSALILGLAMLLTKTSLGDEVPYFIPPILFGISYILVAFSVLKQAVESIWVSKDFFNEFTLMSVATLGALAIGEYPEAVAVMLLYSIGELLQGLAVSKATSNISDLLDVRTVEARQVTESGIELVDVDEVEVGTKIQIRVGDRIPLDGVLLSNQARLNTAALTGESTPQTKYKGETVLSGMVNVEGVIEIETTKLYDDSALSKILEMVQDASDRKAKTELLMRKFARWYTPAVFFLALLVAFAPALFVADYVFTDWLYRALVFLVISCPCALVISIPLSYFGGIGAASKNGILFKGANYLDVLAKVNTVVMDKTGTLTKGVFKVQSVHTEDSKESFLDILSAVETYSSHPIAKAIQEFNKPKQDLIDKVKDVEEIAGHGLKCTIDNEEILVGNSKLLKSHGVSYDKKIDEIAGTTILLSKNGVYQGVVLIADEIKEDATDVVSKLHKEGVHSVVLLSGDNDGITQEVGRKVGVDKAVGDLLPDGKLSYLEQLKEDINQIVCFVGDGINDAPSLALSDVGVAMGGLGSDAAIEVADVVIQNDEPSKVAMAIKIAKATRKVVFQNIALAFGIKAFVLLLGALGLATMWQAVIADVGVTIFAVFNAMRVLYIKNF